MVAILSEFCNIFGAETGGAEKVLGGLSNQPSSRQWYCPRRAIGRFRMRCEHGHQGQIMKICQKHADEFGKSVTFCPRCNEEPPGHKCQLNLIGVS